MDVHSSTIPKAVRWKHPECPADERVNKMWCVHTIKYYPAIKIKHKMNFQNSVLGERSQIQKATYCAIPLIYDIQNRQVQRQSNFSGCQGLGEMESECLMGTECTFGVR